MAVNLLQDPNDPENKNGQAANGVTVPAPGEAPIVPQAGAAGQQTPSGEAPVAQPMPGQGRGRTGSGFQSLQTILAANKANRMGQTVGSGIQQQAGQAKQELQQGVQKFQEHAEANTLGSEQDKQARANIINRITGYQGPAAPTLSQQNDAGKVGIGMGMTRQEMQGQEPAPPAPDLVSKEEAQQFAKFRAGQYSGPRDIENIDALREQSAKAQELGSLTRSMGGQQELLREFVGQRPDYSRGKRSMDALILGQTGASQLQQARQASRGLAQQAKLAQEAAQGVGETKASLAQQFGKDVAAELGETGTDASTGAGLLGGISKSLYGELEGPAGLKARKQAEFDAFQTRLANKALTVQDVEKYVQPLISGADAGPEAALFGLKPEDFKKAYEQGKYDLSSVADPTRFAKLQALQKLSGSNKMQLDSARIGQQEEAVKLGAGAGQFASYKEKQDKYLKDLSDYQTMLGQSEIEQKKYDAFQNALRSKFSDIDKRQYESFSDENGQGLTSGGLNAKGKDMYDALLSAANDPSIATSPEVKQAMLDEAEKLKYQHTEEGGVSELRYRPSYSYSSGGEDYQTQSFSGDTDFAAKFNPNLRNVKSDIGALNTLITGIKEEQNTGGGQLADLLAKDQKEAFTSKYKKDYGNYDQELRDRLLGKKSSEYKSGGSGRTLVELLGGEAGIKRMIATGGASTLIGTPLGHEVGRVLGGVTGDILQGVRNTAGGLMTAVNDFIRWSDKDLKKNIKPGDKKVQKFLDTLKPYSYDYKNKEHGEGKQLSVMAQDLLKSDLGKVAVEQLPQGKAVNYAKLAGTLLASQAQLNDRIKKLEASKKKK